MEYHNVKFVDVPTRHLSYLEFNTVIKLRILYDMHLKTKDLFLFYNCICKIY